MKRLIKSTGIYGYPCDAAAAVAAKVLLDFHRRGTTVDFALLVAFDEATEAAILAGLKSEGTNT